MTTITPDTLIDAIADDLAALDLPDHIDWRKAPPLGLTADNGPWLAVWITRTAHQVLAVQGDELIYSDGHAISIQWAEPSLDIATLTEGDTEAPTATNVLATAGAIQDRLRSYAVAIPHLDGPNLEGTLTSTDYGNVGDALTATMVITIGEIPG